MKRLLLLSLIIFMAIPGIILSQTTRQCDVDSLAVSTTAARATYANSLETATFRFVGCTGLLKVAFTYQDTVWADKKWFSMPDGSTLTISKDRSAGIPGVKKILYKCTSGTGALLIISSRKSDG